MLTRAIYQKKREKGEEKLIDPILPSSMTMLSANFLHILALQQTNVRFAHVKSLSTCNMLPHNPFFPKRAYDYLKYKCYNFLREHIAFTMLSLTTNAAR